MFERSLVESRGLAVSRAQRWSAVGSATVQLMLAVLVVTVPLLRPQTMKLLATAPHLALPPTFVRPPERVQVSASSTSIATPSVTSSPDSPTFQSTGTRVFFPTYPGVPEEGQPSSNNPVAMGPAGGMPSIASGGGSTAITVAHGGSNRPISLSGGVTRGMLLAPIEPAYPQIARIAHVQGNVVIEAIIAKNGRIESAHVTDGPPMLRQAALEAVEAAHYRPYLLSGEPVEVETTITVVFRLGQ